MSSIHFSRDTMRNVLWGEEGRIIADKIEDTSRWSVHHKLIFELNGQTYMTYYSEGATEYQDERPWEYEKEVECFPVELVEKTVKVWEPIP